MNKKLASTIFQLIFGLLALVAIAVQLTRHVGYGFSMVNFFSYFTNLSNLFAAVVLLAGAFNFAAGRVYDLVRGASVLCMAVVGIVFSLLLRNEDLGTLLPWINTVLHYVMPMAIVGFWFLRPPTTNISYKQAAYWLTFPLVYLTYSLVRGAATNWYAYPFLNPTKSGGYVGVMLYCVAILAVFLAFSAVLLRFSSPKSTKA